MKIAILGSGAMGCLYGGLLSANEANQVYLIDVWKEHIDEINRNGLIMEERDKEVLFKNLNAMDNNQSLGYFDLVIIFVKSNSTEKAIKDNISIFGPDTIVVTLQNGLGNPEIIRNVLGDTDIIAGTTAHGATLIGPGRIKHAGIGKTIIGELNGENSERLRIVESSFNRVGIETYISENVIGLIWDKLIVNVGINPLTGITGLKNGELIKHPELEEIMRLAVDEAVKVSNKKGIVLSHKDPVEFTKNVCALTAENTSSMLQDILKGKITEIDMINGAIIREGEKVGIETPVNIVLTNLIKHIQCKQNS